MTDFTSWLSEQKGKKKILEANKADIKKSIVEVGNNLIMLEEVRNILASVGKATQNQVMGYIESLSTLMLQTIYGKQYRLDISFDVKHNKSEACLKVYKGEIELSLKDDETGGGVIDIVALAMRLAMWSLSSPRTSPVFLMDEPLKNLSKDKLPLVGEVLRELSEKMNMQIIMVSHEDELIQIADKAYRVVLEGETSRVEEIG